MTADDRSYDVVLWGATGFTGRRVAAYLARRYEPDELDWALAGRSAARLEELRDDLAERHPAWDALDVLTGDARDRASLESIASQTRVVCSTVGPYAEYGSDLVAACVEHGTDYCDLAGEVHWLQRMVDEHHEAAREAGVRLVHACGFDSVPSDLGTLLVQRHAREHVGTACSSVTAYARGGSFDLSGGTYASILGEYEAAEDDPAVRRAVANPYSLAPADERSGPDGGSQQGPAYDDEVGQWTAPFVMAVINEKVVRRSNALLGYPWGRDFRYREAVPTGTGIAGALRAVLVSAGLGLFAWALSVSFLRDRLRRHVLPAPGEGPSEAAIQDHRFEVRVVGTGRTADDGDEFAVTARVAADRDPGYGATPWMVGEAAVCLAEGDVESPLDGGVLTPASGIGMPLVDRLREVGMTFAVE